MPELEKVTIVLVRIDALRSACETLTTRLAAIYEDASERIVHKTIFLGTEKTLRNFLS